MINRTELKSKAKAAFKGKYWKVFAACLVVSAIVAILGGGSLLGSGLVGPSFTLSLNGLNNSTSDVVISEDEYFGDYYGDGYFGDGYYYDYYEGEFVDPYIDAEFTDGFVAVLAVVALIFILVFGVISVVGIVKNIFIVNPLNVGLRSYFMNNRENKEEFKDVFSAFTNGKYLNTVGTVFTTNLFVSLWSLLFVIPGIYHKYVYWMVPYLCAKRPDISASEARRLSRAITDGYKLEIFVLELSFLGWRILGSIVIFGNYFIEPYIQATYAELYAELRDKAIISGKIRPEEVGVTVTNVFEDEPAISDGII